MGDLMSAIAVNCTLCVQYTVQCKAVSLNFVVQRRVFLCMCSERHPKYRF